MDAYRAIRILALRDVLNHKTNKTSVDYWNRRLARWYSKEFSTPLIAVADTQDLTIEELNQAFYESHYEKVVEGDGYPENIIPELKYLCLSDAELAAQERNSDEVAVEDHEFFQQAEKEAKEFEAQKGKIDQSLAQIAESIKEISMDLTKIPDEDWESDTDDVPLPTSLTGLDP